MSIDQVQLKERFLRYVAVETTANPETDTYPSSQGQFTLGKVLVDELKQIGIEDVVQDDRGLVWATIPATDPNARAVVAFNSHLDTSPEAPGANVQAQVIEDYQGGDIRLPGDPRQVIRVADNPELDTLHGCTLITTDGTTLLGGDDKAGLAIIIQLAATLVDRPEIRHGPIRLLFTCDEEIGRGVNWVNLDRLGADACYTLDGPGSGTIDVETFSGDLAVVRIRGVNIHPSIAKGRMVNAIRVAGTLLEKLPYDSISPETTEGRQGFLHPYVLQGQVDEVVLRVLLRDFDTANLELLAARLREATREAIREWPGAEIEMEVTAQYRNLGDGLTRDPRVVEFAEKAHLRLGRDAKREIIRGGTDGSRLTELGLPTPNLSSGQHNPHSPLEWSCLDEMVQAVEVLVELAQVWAEA